MARSFYILRASAHQEAGWGVPFDVFDAQPFLVHVAEQAVHDPDDVDGSGVFCILILRGFLKRATSSKEISEREEKYSVM